MKIEGNQTSLLVGVDTNLQLNKILEEKHGPQVRVLNVTEREIAREHIGR